MHKLSRVLVDYREVGGGVVDRYGPDAVSFILRDSSKVMSSYQNLPRSTETRDGGSRGPGHLG